MHLGVQNSCFFGPCAGFRQGVGLKNPPNLHRDKKTRVLNFKVHQTCTGTKENNSFELQSAPNLHRDKNTKTSQCTWEGATIPLKLLFFLSLCRFGALGVQNFCFFSLCRFGALWNSKLCFFCPCAGLMHFDHFYFDIGLYCLQIFLTHMAVFASHAAFWRARCIFHAKGLQFEEKIDPFQSQILISGNWSVNITKVICIQDAFLQVFAVFLNMWSYWL